MPANTASANETSATNASGKMMVTGWFSSRAEPCAFSAKQPTYLLYHGCSRSWSARSAVNDGSMVPDVDRRHACGCGRGSGRTDAPIGSLAERQAPDCAHRRSEYRSSGRAGVARREPAASPPANRDRRWLVLKLVSLWVEKYVEQGVSRPAAKAMTYILFLLVLGSALAATLVGVYLLAGRDKSGTSRLSGV